MSVQESYDWDALAKIWTATGRDALWRAHSDAVNSRLLREWLGDNRVDRLLKTDAFDEAVSDGVFPVLRERAQEITVVDVSPNALAAASNRYPEYVTRTADVRDLPFERASFDTIVSLSTLDHFESTQEIDRALVSCRRVLKDGGTLLITLDNLANPLLALRSVLPVGLMRATGLVPYQTGASFGPTGLCDALGRAGFGVDRVEPILHCPRVVAVKIAGLVDRFAGEKGRARFLGAMMSMESMGVLPTRSLSGHFTAALAVAV